MYFFPVPVVVASLASCSSQVLPPSLNFNLPLGYPMPLQAERHEQFPTVAYPQMPPQPSFP